MTQRLWIIDRAVAYVESGRVTIQIDKPTRHLTRKDAFKVADKIWLAGQMRELEIAKQRGETKVIPLTDRRRRSSLRRLGGGFMITQGTNLVVARRDLAAPRPGQFCECGGVFEVREQPQDDPLDVSNDFVASLLNESQEIVIKRRDILYIPQLPPSSSAQSSFHPPGTLDAYNKTIEHEVRREVKKAYIQVAKYRKFWMKILDYDQAVRLQYAYSPELSVEITAEVDRSSLECVGVLSFPEDIDKAVIAFLEDSMSRLTEELNEATSNKLQLENRINTAKVELEQAREERKVELEQVREKRGPSGFLVGMTHSALQKRFCANAAQ